jgi:hypothetical protein
MQFSSGTDDQDLDEAFKNPAYAQTALQHHFKSKTYAMHCDNSHIPGRPVACSISPSFLFDTDDFSERYRFSGTSLSRPTALDAMA